MSPPEEAAAFESVDWSAIEAEPRWPTAEVVTLVAGGLVLLAAFLYDRYVTHVYLVLDWRVDALEWLFLLGLLILTAFGLVPVLKRWDRTRVHLRRLLSRPATAFSLVFLALLFLVGLFGPVVLEPARLQFGHAFTPPVGFSTEVSRHTCGGVVTGEPFSFVCEGTWEHPLGTNHRGHPIEYLLMTGARVSLYVIVFTAAFVVPIGITTGLVAGLRGGLVDDLLMSYVDIQLSLPAIIVYFIAYTYWNVSLLLLLLTFGLLSWGGVARLVRSEVLQRREEGYVLASRAAGASKASVAKAHLLPNVTNTVVPAVFHLVPVLILTEAGIAFLGFEDARAYSWGETIADGLGQTVSAASPADRFHNLAVTPLDVWWVSAVPAVVLALTLVAFKLAGDGIRDALDPRGER